MYATPPIPQVRDIPRVHGARKVLELDSRGWSSNSVNFVERRFPCESCFQSKLSHNLSR